MKYILKLHKKKINEKFYKSFVETKLKQQMKLQKNFVEISFNLLSKLYEFLYWNYIKYKTENSIKYKYKPYKLLIEISLKHLLKLDIIICWNSIKKIKKKNWIKFFGNKLHEIIVETL